MDQLFAVDVTGQLCLNWLTVVSVQIWANLNVVVFVRYELNVVASHLQVFRLERLIYFVFEKTRVKRCIDR